jgi:hypothetical protein
MAIRVVLAGAVVAGVACLALAPSAVAGPFIGVDFGTDSAKVVYGGTYAVISNSPIYFSAECAEKDASAVTSPLFGSVTLHYVEVRNRLEGETHAAADVRTGTYPVSFTCAGKKITTKLKVDGVDLTTTPSPIPASPTSPTSATTASVPTRSTTPPPASTTSRQVVVKPSGAPETGDGSTVQSSTPGLAGLGVAAVVAGAGGLAWWRRRASHG